MALLAGANCWRIERATKAAVVVDAADYFRLARQAMMAAQHQILLIGWDFDSRIRLVGEPTEDGAPAAVGPFIDWLVRRTPALDVRILRWDIGALKTLFRGSTLLTVARWTFNRHVHVKLDGHHPTGASHHQKIVVIDDCLAFCGGIDMTDRRWDTREHLDDDPRRRQAGGQPCGPWHDASMMIAGPAARALGELSRDRWKAAGGRAIAAPPPRDECWPDGAGHDFTEVDLAISRTVPALPDEPEQREIEALYLDLVARARRFIYAESQYFASRRVAEAMATRLEEPDGPEIVIVNPVTADGWLEPIAMDTARARLVAALRRRDPHKRLRIFHPVTAGGTPIYVHAKVTVVDDAVLRVGSSNFNNRSLGLDTECDVTIDTALPANVDSGPAIAAIRDGLLAEHLGTTSGRVAAELAARGSLIATIEALRTSGRTLVDYEVPDLPAIEKWLADNEVLDPEAPGTAFESIGKRRLTARLLRRR